ncbi:MAG: Stenotrophomonas phage Mendera [Planctomycetota bacterium]
MSSAVGSSNQTSLTNGNFFDVRDFGAKAEYGFDNTPAFQAAIDHVTSLGGGTVHIPASGSWPHYYWLEKPVYINGNSVAITGDGTHSTVLWTWGPAFMFTRHPRLWDSAKTSYLDTDTGLNVNALDDNREFLFEDRYKIDLYRFTANGDIKAGSSGQPPLDISFFPNHGFAIRPRNMVKGIFQGNPMATGGLEGWESKKQVTFEFITFAHDRPIEGGIAGAGDWFKPDPWLFSGNSSEFHFCMALTDDTLVNKVHCRLKFAQPQSLGLHRVCIQLDWTNRKFTVFVDRKQVDFVIELDSGATPAELFTKYNSMARWEYAEFAIGSRCRLSNKNEDQLPSHSDYSVLAAKIWPELRYVSGSAGQTQAKIDGSPVKDDDALMFNFAGAMAGLFVNEPTGSDLLILNGNRDRCFGMLVPVGKGPTPVAYCKVADLGVEGMVFASQGDGITLGPYLHLDMHNVTVRNGFFNSIGSLDCYISYPLFMSGCRLFSKGSSFFGLNQSAIHAQNTTFGYVSRAAIRLAGCGSHWEGGITNDFEHDAEAFLLAYRGNSIGAGHRLENIMIDTEGTRVSPKVAYFYVQKANYVSNNGLSLKRVSTGQCSDVPTIYLDDPDFRTWLYSPGFVQIEDCAFGHEGPVIRVCGKDWQGSVDVIRWACADAVVQVDTEVWPDINVKTVHRDMKAPPNLGGWYAGAHDILITRPPEGGVSAWDCAQSGFEGSTQPPVWMPREFRISRRKNVISGNVFPTVYASVVAKHPKMSEDSTLKFGLFQDYSAHLILEYLLNRSGNFDRTQAMFAIDPYLVNRSFIPRGGLRQTALLNNDANLWNPAANGRKTNKVELKLQDPNVGAWPVDQHVRRRQASLFIVTGNSNWDYNSVVGVVAGRFQPQPADFFDSETITIPAGGLVLANADREGSWSTLAQNQILDWVFGNADIPFPSKFYIGLSKTPIGDDGTGLTEISGAGYSRVGISLQGNQFQAHDEYGSTWSNRFDIAFGNPQDDWGPCEWFFLSDSAAGGQIWASGPLNQPVVIHGGDQPPVFTSGNLQLQI